MRKLIKDQDGNIFELASPKGLVPSGYEEVSAEELGAAELSLARKNKVDEVRARRDSMMLVHDKVFLIALKDGTPTTAILADRQVLLDLPENAQGAVNVLETVEEVKAYDAFTSLNLSISYE